MTTQQINCLTKNTLEQYHYLTSGQKSQDVLHFFVLYFPNKVFHKILPNKHL